MARQSARAIISIIILQMLNEIDNLKLDQLRQLETLAAYIQLMPLLLL